MSTFPIHKLYTSAFFIYPLTQIPSSTVVAVDPLKIGIGTRGRERMV
jgi:hypothetical protein